MRRSILVMTLGLGTLSGQVLADEVQFKNGDRLSGKIKSAGDGKLVIESTMAGTVTVDLNNVKTFSTEAPIEMRLKDGGVIHQKFEVSETAGEIKTANAAEAPVRTVSIATVSAVNPPKVKWTGALTLSGLVTQGNSSTENFGLALEASRRAERDRRSVGAGYLYGRERDPDTGDKNTTTDNWNIFGKYDYFMSEKVYAFGMAKLEHDGIAELNMRVSPSVGLGYQWVEKPTFNFSTEGGLAWVYEDYENGDSNDHFAIRLAYRLDRKLNDKVDLFHNLEFLPSIEDPGDYNLNADAGIRAALTGSMYSEIKVEWRRDSNPAPDAAENDLRYILGVGWKF